MNRGVEDVTSRPVLALGAAAVAVACYLSNMKPEKGPCVVEYDKHGFSITTEDGQRFDTGHDKDRYEDIFRERCLSFVPGEKELVERVNE